MRFRCWDDGCRRFVASDGSAFGDSIIRKAIRHTAINSKTPRTKARRLVCCGGCSRFAVSDGLRFANPSYELIRLTALLVVAASTAASTSTSTSTSTGSSTAASSRYVLRLACRQGTSPSYLIIQCCLSRSQNQYWLSSSTCCFSCNCDNAVHNTNAVDKVAGSEGITRSIIICNIRSEDAATLRCFSDCQFCCACFYKCLGHASANGVILISRQSHRSQNSDDRHNDHQFNKSKTLLHLSFHLYLLKVLRL